ncbi:MAG: ZIP family metal transporter [Acidimicrobiia bacterium]
MSGLQTALLGLIAGVTILLGIPVGRLRNLSRAWRTALSGVASGILIFLAYEFFEYSVEGIEAGASALRASLFVVGLVGSFAALFAYGTSMRRSANAMRKAGPGAATTAELRSMQSTLSVAQRLAIMIAIGIGLHNLAEGLAIGQSSATGKYSLAMLLIIGFALHNATEGFGIVGPMTAANERGSWPFLLLLAAIGGLPVFFGTLIGQVWVNETFEVAVLGLATGSVLYVIYEMGRTVLKNRQWLLLGACLVLGFAIGLGTEMIVYAGANG